MKKLVYILLLISMLITVIGCSESDGNNIPVNTSDVETTIAGDMTETEIKPDLPDVQYDGYDFRFFVRGPEANVEWEMMRNIYTEEMTGEPLNDALYNRNRKIEDQYNITISATPSNPTTESANNIINVILSGDDVYDVIIPGMNQFGTLIMSGVLVDLYDLPYIGWDKPWWDQNLIRDLSIGGKLYGMMGDIGISTVHSTRILLFNKTMKDDYELDNPYDLVNDNKWTFDKMAEMSKSVLTDLNGDGAMDNNDIFGYLIQKYSTVTLFYSAGENTTSKNSDDIPYFSIENNQRAVSVVEKAMDIFTSDYVYIGEDAEIKLMFEQGRGLFFSEVLNLAEMMRESDVNFGIVPVPKYDENQENFYHYADTWCMNLLGIPLTNTELERTSVILEALSAESSKTIVPAFYETNLVGKFFRDEESEEILKLINGTRVISMDEMFDWGIHSAIFTLFSNLNYNITSSIESTIEPAKLKLESTVEYILNNE